MSDRAAPPPAPGRADMAKAADGDTRRTEHEPDDETLGRGGERPGTSAATDASLAPGAQTDASASPAGTNQAAGPRRTPQSAPVRVARMRC